MFTVSTDLKHTISNIKHEMGDKLHFKGETPSRAAWMIGNALITAREVGNGLTEIGFTAGRMGGDKLARDAWQGLIRELAALGLDVKPSGTDERQAEKALAQIFGDDYSNDDYLSGKPISPDDWVPEQAARAFLEEGQTGPAEQAGVSVRIPKQIKRLNDWRARWQRVKPEWGKGVKGYAELARWLTNQCGLVVSAETLADIIKAGEAGKLD